MEKKHLQKSILEVFSLVVSNVWCIDSINWSDIGSFWCCSSYTWRSNCTRKPRISGGLLWSCWTFATWWSRDIAQRGLLKNSKERNEFSLSDCLGISSGCSIRQPTYATSRRKRRSIPLLEIIHEKIIFGFRHRKSYVFDRLLPNAFVTTSSLKVIMKYVGSHDEEILDNRILFLDFSSNSRANTSRRWFNSFWSELFRWTSLSNPIVTIVFGNSMSSIRWCVLYCSILSSWTIPYTSSFSWVSSSLTILSIFYRSMML